MIIRNRGTYIVGMNTTTIINRYWGYARVSTEGQSDNSIEVQLRYLRIKAEEANLEFVPHSEKLSGSSIADRPELNYIKAHAQSGDIIGVYDSSRLSRNTLEALQFVDDLIKRKIKVQIGGKTLDESSPRDEFLFTIESAVAQLQRKEQNLKSRVGIAERREKGDWLFTGRMLGYDVVKKGSLLTVTINEHEAGIIRYIFQEYANGKSLNQITSELIAKGYRTKDGEEFVTATVRRYIHKPIYKGFYKLESGGGGQGQDKIPLQGATLVRSNLYEPIVSEELWDAVALSYRTLRRSHSIQFPYHYAQNELSSIIKCYYCKKLGKPTGYVHSYHKYPGSERTNSNYINRVHLRGCKQTRQTLRASVFEAIFRLCFCLVFSDESEINHFLIEQNEMVQANNVEVQKDIARLDQTIQEIEKKENNIIKAIVDFGIDDSRLALQLDELKREKKRLLEERGLKAFQISQCEEIFLQYREEYSERALTTFLKEANPASRRKRYIGLLKHAYIYNGRLVILYNNSKVFVITLAENKGRRIQKKFEAKVGYSGREQYTVSLDTDTEEITLCSVKKNPLFIGEGEQLYRAKVATIEQQLREISRRMHDLSIIEEKVDEKAEN